MELLKNLSLVARIYLLLFLQLFPLGWDIVRGCLSSIIWLLNVLMNVGENIPEKKSFISFLVPYFANFD
jgi:hypothetical protein